MCYKSTNLLKSVKTEHENRKGANGTWDKVITEKRKDQKTGRKGKNRKWSEEVTGSRSGWRIKWKKGRWKGQEEKKRKKRMWGVLFTISLFNVLSLKTHKHSQRMYLELTRWYFLQKNRWLWHMCVSALSATLMLIGQSCDLWWTYFFRGQFVDFLCALYLLHNLHKQKMHMNVTPSHLALVLVFLGKFLALLVQVFQITFSQKRGADKRVTSN